MQHYIYDGSGHLSLIYDLTSVRVLRVTWTGNVITQVATDPPASGQQPLVWTYGYTNGRLTSVCTPLGASSCVTYSYTNGTNSGSFYRASVLDSNPAGYWPLGESPGATVATNVAARTVGQDGTYSSVTLGAAGPLAGTADTAATFSAATGSKVTLPAGFVSSAGAFTTELWFKAAAGATGVLFGEQDTAGTSWNPMLYVGSDGQLRGMAPVLATPSTMVGINNKCVDARDGSNANGTVIQDWDCNGLPQQSWRRYPDGTIRYGGRCLDITGAQTGAGIPIQLYDCHANWNQIWEPYNGALRNPYSARCLDLNGSETTSNGVQLTIWDCSGGSNQQWTVPSVVTRSRPPPP